MQNNRIKKLPFSGNQLVLIGGLLGITVLFTILNDNFFTYTTFINILLGCSLTGLTAIGITFLIMTGGNDLSAGSVSAAVGMFIAWGLENTELNWIVLCLISLAFAAVAGLLNGLMVTKLNIVPFIATLASQSVWRGVAYLLCDGKPIMISDKGLQEFAKGRLLLFEFAGDKYDIPYSVIIMFVFFIIFSFVLSKTKFGRSIFAIGGNQEAARLAGINSTLIKNITYVMTAMFAGLAGIILAGRMNSGNPAASPNLHFDAITAANLGGVSMVGGVGSIPSVFLGVLLVQAFNTGLTMVQVSTYWQYVARGMLLFASLAIDFIRQRNREKKLLADTMKNM